MILIVRPWPSDNHILSRPTPFFFSPGDEECSQGGTELLGVEGAERPQPQTLVVPRAEHPAHDGPCRTGDTEGGLSRKRGRDF